MLTDKEIRGLKPSDKDIQIADGNGLYLRVHKSGRKQFLLRTRIGGKAKYHILGEYPNLGLAEARKAAVNFDASPVDEVVTVDKVFTDFYKHVKRRYKNPHTVEYKYQKIIAPRLAHKPIKSVTRAEVAKLLQEIVDRGSPIMANRVLTDIKLLFNFAVEQGHLEFNQLQPLTKKSVGGREKPRTKVLSVDEIKELLLDLMTPRLDYRTRTALAVALLTGLRISEVINIGKGKVVGHWLHQEDNKSDRLHKVYLTPQVRALLKVSTTEVSDYRVIDRAVKRMGVSWTPHDFRRTMTTYLNDMGVMPHVTEKMLNHRMEGVMAVYNHAEYLPERQQAWKAWGNYIWKLRREVLRQMQPPFA
jgi:integrase